MEHRCPIPSPGDSLYLFAGKDSDETRPPSSSVRAFSAVTAQTVRVGKPGPFDAAKDFTSRPDGHVKHSDATQKARRLKAQCPADRDPPGIAGSHSTSPDLHRASVHRLSNVLSMCCSSSEHVTKSMTSSNFWENPHQVSWSVASFEHVQGSFYCPSTCNSKCLCSWTCPRATLPRISHPSTDSWDILLFISCQAFFISVCLHVLLRDPCHLTTDKGFILLCIFTPQQGACTLSAITVHLPLHSSLGTLSIWNWIWELFIKIYYLNSKKGYGINHRI